MNPKSILYKSIGLGINALSVVAPHKAGAVAFGLFAKPPKPRIRPKEAAFLATAKRLDETFEGKEIAVYQWGSDDAPYVFCSYGWGYNAGRWRYYVPPLVEAGLRVIAFDPPGHGNSVAGRVEYPLMVRLQTRLIERFGRPKLFLGHSFGAGCLIGTLAGLPAVLRPDRVCLMGTFSEARYIFHLYRDALGLRQSTYRRMTEYIHRIEGRRLSSYDNAKAAAELGDVPCLIIHDPADDVTAFSNALRNHAYWPGSYLFRAAGAGHHLGTAGVTRVVMNWLIDGLPPAQAERSTGRPDAHHDLCRFFTPLEQDTLHGRTASSFFGN